jgi:hypothetical protein
MAERDKETVVVTDGDRGGGGNALVAVVLLLAVIVVLFLLFGGTDLFSGGASDVNADVDISVPGTGGGTGN